MPIATIWYLLLAPILLVGGTQTAFAGATVGDPEPQYRVFGDWVVGCDNTRRCMALGLPPDWEGGNDQSEGPSDHYYSLVLVVERGGGGAASATIRLAYYVDCAEVDGPLLMTVDDAPIPGVPAYRLAVHGTQSNFMSAPLAADEIGPFIDALRRGSSLRVTNSRGQTAKVSLVGAMAALLFMDDVQGRVATETALARRGPKPASAVPAAPPEPVVRAVPAPKGAVGDRSLIARVRAQLKAEITPETADWWPADADEAHPLGNDKVLIKLMCDGGAYNRTFAFYIVQSGDVQNPIPVHFPAPLPREEQKEDSREDDNCPENALTNAFFKPDTGILTYFSKSRGLGDCGTRGEFAWTGEHFERVGYGRMDECRGVIGDYWPILWRTAKPR